jgi:hypothetical protein
LINRESKWGDKYLLFFIVLTIKNDLVRLFSDLAEMNKIAYFAEHSHFGAIGRLGGADHFFSPAQYYNRLTIKQLRGPSCSSW